MAVLVNFLSTGGLRASLMSEIKVNFVSASGEAYIAVVWLRSLSDRPLDAQLKGMCTLSYSTQDTSLGNTGIKNMYESDGHPTFLLWKGKKQVQLYICNILFLKYIQREQTKSLFGRGEKS